MTIHPGTARARGRLEENTALSSTRTTSSRRLPTISSQRPQPPPQQYYYPMPVPQHLQYPYPPPRAPPVQQAATLVSTMDPVCNTASSSMAGTCVTVIESKGKQHKARALIDSCLTFITPKLVSTLKMHKISEPTAVTGFQQIATPVSKSKVNFHLRIPSGTVTILVPVQAVVVDVITGDLPASTLAAVRQTPTSTSQAG